MSEQKKSTTKEQQRTFLIAAVLLVAVIIIVSLSNNGETTTSETPTENTSNNTEQNVDSEDPTLTNFAAGYGLDQFADLDQAGRIINSSQGKPTTGDGSEQLVAQVVDAAEEPYVYFATTSPNPEDQSMLSSIYRYNTVTNRWERIYKTTFTTSEEGNLPYYRVVGKVSNNLVLFRDDYENSPGPCADFLLMSEQENRGLFLLNLEDPYGGFTEIELSGELREQAQGRVQECQREFGM